MKVLRIKLRQSQASYSMAETVTNRMTYPLPPLSTIIGAIHNACGYSEYHPMSVSVQGKYGAMGQEIYVNHSLLNRREDDRNVLVYLQNPNMLTAGLTIIGESLKSQGNSFKKRESVRILEEEYYEEFLKISNLKEILDLEKKEIVNVKINEIKEIEKQLKDVQKKLEKKSVEYTEISQKITELKRQRENIEKIFKEKLEKTYTIPMSHYKTLVKSPQFQEVLYDVELMIHIDSDEETLMEIEDNINNLVSIGRSEDFIELIETKMVDLIEPEKDYRLPKEYCMYVSQDKIVYGEDFDDFEEDKEFYFVHGDNKKNAKGTVYYLDKRYRIVDKKRIFEKIPCICTSNIGTGSSSIGKTVDEDGNIVDLN